MTLSRPGQDPLDDDPNTLLRGGTALWSVEESDDA